MCEMPAVYSESNPVARKEHKCCECCGTIKPGEKYQVIKGIWDGQCQTYKTCPECAVLREVINKGLHGEDMTPLTCIEEFVMEDRSKAHVTQLLAIKRSRNADIAEWMLRVESEVVNNQDGVNSMTQAEIARDTAEEQREDRAAEQQWKSVPPSSGSVHRLKTWPVYFQAIRDGRKNFEIRKNDRDFNEGDILILEEWDPLLEKHGREGKGEPCGEYTGRKEEVRVTYITGFNQPSGQVVMAFVPTAKASQPTDSLC